jgi:RNA polymerase sigma-70 factor (ECF subfamily)
MARLADGDRSAFDPLYDALWPSVRRLAERMLLGAPEAEDAAQEAMTKLFARASDFEPGRSVTSWVLAMTAYECLSQRQKRRRRREHDGTPLEVTPDGSRSPEAAIIARDHEAAALEVLGTLRPDDVETIRALLLDARPNLPRATFRKRIERALARLRAAWSSRHGVD